MHIAPAALTVTGYPVVLDSRVSEERGCPILFQSTENLSDAEVNLFARTARRHSHLKFCQSPEASSANCRENAESSVSDQGVSIVTWLESTQLSEKKRQIEVQQSMAEGMASRLRDIISSLSDRRKEKTGRTPQLWPTCIEQQRIQCALIRTRCLVRKLDLFCGKRPAKNRPIQLSFAVNSFLENFRSYIPQNIDVTKTVEKNLPLVDADPVLIQKQLHNLCMNSLEAMNQKGGNLTIDLRMGLRRKDKIPGKSEEQSSKVAKLTIADTGIGIYPCDMHQIFYPFYTTKQNKMSAARGLGLAEVYGIVKSMYASIQVRSKVGTGTAFEVCYSV